MLRENNGVTLVALVITIIVLLILAGVSISMVAGDNGILTQATNAADATTLGQIESDLSLALSSCQTNYFAARYGSDTDATVAEYFTVDAIKTAMGSAYTSVTSSTTTITAGTEFTLTITYDGLTYSAGVTVTTNGGASITTAVAKS